MNKFKNNPFKVFEDWYDRHKVVCEKVSQIKHEYNQNNSPSTKVHFNAVALATANIQSQPSVRMVLLKKYDSSGFYFFTNYKSQKGCEITQNPQASLLFFFHFPLRQVRIFGKLTKTSKVFSENYWKTRDRESQVTAYASQQSQVLTSRTEFQAQRELIKKKFKDQDIPLPDHWGGYCLVPNYFEFWQVGESRFHGRTVYKKENDKWIQSFLQP